MANKCLKLFLCILLAITVMVPSAHCAQNHVEFKLVLSKGELEGKSFDVVKLGLEKLYIWRLHYLSDRDLDKVEIKRSATWANAFMIVIKFNKEGRKRLYKFTKKFAKRRVAIFADGKLMTTPIVWIPHFMGDKVVTRWPGSKKDLFDLAHKVNNANPSIGALYIEEQGAYNDAAADEWAKYYSNVNNFIEEKRKSMNADAREIESGRDI